MDLELTGKRVLVTGASRGIGKAISGAFLQEQARVLMVARGQEQLENSSAGFKAKYGADQVKNLCCDCSDATALQGLAVAADDLWQGLDVVVANVGDGRSVPDALPDADCWQATWNANFETALQTARTFLPMLEKSGGCLLFISSIAGIEAIGAPVDYSTAKAAIFALAKNMARKLAPEIRVNVIAPGNILFPGGSWQEKINADAARVDSIIASTVPMKRFGKVDEIADAAVFLCSTQATFITGSVLVVDGGQTVGVM